MLLLGGAFFWCPSLRAIATVVRTALAPQRPSKMRTATVEPEVDSATLVISTLDDFHEIPNRCSWTVPSIIFTTLFVCLLLWEPLTALYAPIGIADFVPFVISIVLASSALTRGATWLGIWQPPLRYDLTSSGYLITETENDDCCCCFRLFYWPRSRKKKIRKLNLRRVRYICVAEMSVFYAVSEPTRPSEHATVVAEEGGAHVLGVSDSMREHPSICESMFCIFGTAMLLFCNKRSEKRCCFLAAKVDDGVDFVPLSRREWLCCYGRGLFGISARAQAWLEDWKRGNGYMDADLPLASEVEVASVVLAS